MEKLIDIVFNVVAAFIVKIIGIVMVVSVLLQIASRYLPVTFMWTDELARLAFIWFCMLSTAIAYEKGNHLFIDYFTLKMSKKTQLFVDYAVCGIVLVFSVILTIKGVELLGYVSSQRSPVMNLSMSVFYAAIPFGFGMIVVFSVLSMIHRLMNHKKIVCDIQK